MDAKTIAIYRTWRTTHDEGYCYDEIFNWVDGQLSRGELLRIMDAAAGVIPGGHDAPERTVPADAESR